MATTFMQMVEDAKKDVEGITISNAVSAARYNPDTLIIDVRDRADIAATGLVPNAVPISLGTLGFKADHTLEEAGMLREEFKDKDRQIIVTCTLGAMAALGAKQLHDMGYTNVRYMEGGTNAWKAAGLDVEAFEA